jgi:predicted nucleic acid-binding protein
MKVYFDSCVYNRPFDDHQRQEKIFIEAMAFYLVLKWVEEGKIELVNSDALMYENELTSDLDRKLRVKTYLSLAKHYIELSDKIIDRAHEIISLGFKSIDALHIAMAEYSSADYFVTCDNAIIKKGKNLHDGLKVKVLGILDFLAEVLHVKDIEGN